MHERKQVMADAADAFIALPGGFGTLEEVLETLTWSQLGLHDKPVGLLDTSGYYGPLVAFVQAAVDAGFVRPQHRDLVLVADEPARLLALLAEAEGMPRPDVEKWVEREAR